MVIFLLTFVGYIFLIWLLVEKEKLRKQLREAEESIVSLSGSLNAIHQFLSESQVLKSDLDTFNAQTFIPKHAWLNPPGPSLDHAIACRDRIKFSVWWMDRRVASEAEMGNDDPYTDQLKAEEKMNKDKVKVTLTELVDHFKRMPSKTARLSFDERNIEWVNKTDNVASYLRWLIPELEYEQKDPHVLEIVGKLRAFLGFAVKKGDH